MTLQKSGERAFLVALDVKSRMTDGWAPEDSLSELENLVETAGAVIVGKEIQSRLKPDTATYIGRGKAEELQKIVEMNEIDLVVFDGELTPVQQRNLEEVIARQVIDRTTVILDIFAQRARSREAQLQVELALLNYRLPRITGKGTELSRLGGGIGTRGPGETKLEVDRRRIRDRIASVKKELEEVKAHRTRLRGERARQPLPVVALTGYTNAGKSTLHRALAGSDVLVEDRLFATLDATTRRVDPEEGEPYLLVDTVGFIHNLPTFLIAAFRSTLEEVSDADLLLHVVDVSHPKREEQMQTVEEVLTEVGAGDTPTLLVYNKVDQVDIGKAQRLFHGSLAITVAAALGENVDGLQRAIQQALADRREVVELVIPFEKTAWVSWVFERGRIMEQQHRENGTYIQAELEKGLAKKLRKEVGFE